MPNHTIGTSSSRVGGSAEVVVAGGGGDDHDLPLHIYITGCGVAGEPFYQGVGHDLIPGPTIAGGFGGVGVLP
jgi:hypothetical protein